MSDSNPQPRPFPTNRPNATPADRAIGYNSTAPLSPSEENTTGSPSFAVLFFGDLLSANPATRLFGGACVLVIIACIWYVGGGLVEDDKLPKSRLSQEAATPVKVMPPPGVAGLPDSAELRWEIQVLEAQLGLDQVNSLLLSPAYSTLPDSASLAELMERREVLRSIRAKTLESDLTRSRHHSPELKSRREARQQTSQEAGGGTSSPDLNPTGPTATQQTTEGN